MSAFPADPIALGLPHRAPFILVESVLSLEAGQSATCRKVFHTEEPVFQGHFPGDPLVPGVLMTEALAQTAGLAAGHAGRTFYLSAIRSMKFLAPVRPEDEILLVATKTAVVGSLWQFAVEATVAGTKVAEGMLILSEVSA